MIIVTGATGKLGSAVVEHLLTLTSPDRCPIDRWAYRTSPASANHGRLSAQSFRLASRLVDFLANVLARPR